MASRYIANTAREQRGLLGLLGDSALDVLLVGIPPQARPALIVRHS